MGDAKGLGFDIVGSKRMAFQISEARRWRTRLANPKGGAFARTER